MKVVALVSGGKDSCYNMQLCQSYGHEIVALANLLPLYDAVDELDSFMYQTVGHQVVAAFAQCMGLPLFRRRIRGSPRSKDLRYSKTDGDEVEDLEILLRAVKRQVPGLGGVSTGAIASDYQRLRVENVCSRLDLVSLAYMWKQEQASLLQNMIDSGLQAVLVKVAAMGLDPRKHLGKDLSTLQSLFLKLHSLYGCNVCGEGGEYESLTLDCSLFKNAKIVLDEFTIQLHSPDTIAPVGVLHPVQFHLELKSTAQEHVLTSSNFLVEITDDFLSEKDSEIDIQKDSMRLTGCMGNQVSKIQTSLLTNVTKQRHGIVAIQCWRQSDNPTLEDVQHELSYILVEIERSLQAEELGWANVLYIHLYLNDMKHFLKANQIYLQHISEKYCIQGVPSRCCVELPLGQAGMGQVSVEVLAARDPTKNVLHVQSISSWAPSCIGPYSQATHHGQLMYMAGQIGLDPPTMNLVAGGPSYEMAQALKNCEAVGKVFTSNFSDCILSFTVFCASAACVHGIEEVERALDKYLSSCKEFRQSGVDSILHRPLVLYILLPGLPKDALVEVAPLTYLPAAAFGSLSDEDEEENPPIWQQVSLQSSTSGLQEHCLCHGLIKRGHLCRALVFMSTGKANVVDTGFHEKAALEQGFQLLSNILTQSSLVWADVLVLRVYFVVEKVKRKDLRDALQEVREDLAFSNVPQPAMIPVLGLGETSRMQDLMTLELIASCK